MSAQAITERPLDLRRSVGALETSDARLGWAPIVAALTVDLADFATAGPIGLVAGLAVGGALTSAVALANGVRPRRAVGLGLMGALYCAFPMTEAVPLATLLTALHGFLFRRRALAQAPCSTTRDGG